MITYQPGIVPRPCHITPILHELVRTTRQRLLQSNCSGRDAGRGFLMPSSIVEAIPTMGALMMNTIYCYDYIRTCIVMYICVSGSVL